MGAFERLQAYSSGLKAAPPVAVNDELSEINRLYNDTTPLGYYLKSLHQLGYKVVEPIYKSGETTLSKAQYKALSDEEKNGYVKEFQLTEFAQMLLQDGDCLVVSGAGSGKTSALVFKIIKDILTGEATRKAQVGDKEVTVVDSIFVGTFLKSGADELKETVEKWQRKLGYIVTTGSMQFGTLHAEFKRALNAMGVETPIGAPDVVSKCLKKAVEIIGIERADGRKLGFEDYTTIESIVCYYRNKISSDKYNHPSCEDYNLTPVVLDSLVKLFAQRRASEGIMDFEDLQELLYKYLYLTPNKAVQDFVANRYKYIYIDEFQDTSEIQYAILKFYARNRLHWNKGGESVITQSQGGDVPDALYTGTISKGKFVAIGDDDQCVLGHNRVITPDGVTWIMDVQENTQVLSYSLSKETNKGVFQFCECDKPIRNSYVGEIYSLFTEGGREINGTPKHTVYVKRDAEEVSEDVSELLNDTSVLCTIAIGEDAVCEKGNWVSLTFETTNKEIVEKLFDVSIYQLIDGVYKVEFFFKNIDDGYEMYRFMQSKAEKLFEGGDFNSPIQLYQSEYIFYGSMRFYRTQLSEVKDDDFVLVENSHSLSYERVRSITVSAHHGAVYDISVPKVRNYSVNGVLCHNCIYSWRGSSVDVMTTSFPLDFKPTIITLSKNYRCPSNILNPVLPSIALNKNRYAKQLVSSREGGEFNVYHFVGITPMLSHLLAQIDEDMANNRDVAIICRTNFDGVVPAFMLEMNHKYTFSVSSDAMTLNASLPRTLLNVCRLFTDKCSIHVKNTLELFVPYRERWCVKKVYDKLKQDATVGLGTSIWTLDPMDLAYSAPDLLPVVNDLKALMFDASGEEIEGGAIRALKKAYHMLHDVYFNDDNSYCVRVRSYIEAILYLLNTKNFSYVEEFLDEVTEYSDRLKARVKKSGTKINIVTVHEFKGKERDSVYVWHDSDTFFPSNKTDLHNEEQVSEERRVHYIACTRARKKCTIYALRNGHGLFLDEMDMKAVDPTVITGSVQKNSQTNLNKSCSDEAEKLKTTLSSFTFKDANLGGKPVSQEAKTQPDTGELLSELPDVANMAGV